MWSVGAFINKTKVKCHSLAEQGKQAYESAKEKSVVVALTEDMFWRYKRTNVSLLTGSIAYRIFLFIVPCALVIVALAGATTAQGGDIGNEVGEKMRLGAALKSAMSHAGSDASGGWQVALTVGFLGVLAGAYGLYSALFGAFAQVWELPLDITKKRAKQSARFILGLVVFILFLYGMAWVRRQGVILGMLGFLVSITADMLLFLMMSIALPHRGTAWYNLVPGALAGGAGTLGLQIAAATWVPNQIAQRTETYGALGIAVALLAYLAVLGFVLCLVPLVNATWHSYVQSREEEIDLRESSIVRRSEKLHSLLTRDRT